MTLQEHKDSDAMDSATHYAVSTGALHTTVMFAEISLRVTLQGDFTDNAAHLRREMADVLDMLQRALKEQRVRDAAQDVKWRGSLEGAA